MKKFNPVNIGEKFSRLLVLKETATEKSGRYFLCACDCGKEKIVKGSSLRYGSSKSCGCLAADVAKKLPHVLPAGEPTLRDFEQIYRRQAKNRNKNFELTRDQFRNIIKQNCYYCGEFPERKNSYINKSGQRRLRSNVTVEKAEENWVYINGVDRLNSDLGYTIENCVPCCKLCNLIKREIHVKDFLNLVQKIYKTRIAQ